LYDRESLIVVNGCCAICCATSCTSSKNEPSIGVRIGEFCSVVVGAGVVVVGAGVVVVGAGVLVVGAGVLVVGAGVLVVGAGVLVVGAGVVVVGAGVVVVGAGVVVVGAGVVVVVIGTGFKLGTFVAVVDIIYIKHHLFCEERRTRSGQFRSEEWSIPERRISTRNWMIL